MLEVDAATRAEIEDLRRQGYQVQGPAPMSRTQTMATRDVDDTLPGCHVQIGRDHRWVEGFGGTPAEALADARVKLTPYDPTAKVGAG